MDFMTFINQCTEWIQNNLALAIVLAVAALFVIVLLIVIISLATKASRAKKKLAKKQAAEEKAAAEKQAAEKAIADKEEEKRLAKEKAEAERKAVLERLEAERLAAEKEEAEAKAADEKAEADRIAAEKAKAEEEAKAKAEAEKAAQAEEKAKAKKTTKAKSAKAVKEESAATSETAATESVSPAEAKETAPVKEKKAAKAAPKKTEEKKAVKAEKPVLYDEMKDAEEEDDIWYDENEVEKVARYAGKWAIYHILTDDHSAEDEMYFFELHASNGEKLLSSEEYTSYNGALRGIETHKANILKDNFKITLSKKGDYIFKLLSGKNMLLCMGENYPTKTRCENAIKSAKRFARTAVIDENVQDYVIKVPAEDDGTIEPLPEGYNGKWIISSRDGADDEKVFYFELFANNGEKLLTSEEYTTYAGAVNGVHTHKTNIEKGNFRISLTKRGDYIYKLLNGNGQLLCLGEHYKTKRRCLNAVESVKRFATKSPILTEQNLTK